MLSELKFHVLFVVETPYARFEYVFGVILYVFENFIIMLLQERWFCIRVSGATDAWQLSYKSLRVIW